MPGMPDRITDARRRIERVREILFEHGRGCFDDNSALRALHGGGEIRYGDVSIRWLCRSCQAAIVCCDAPVVDGRCVRQGDVNRICCIRQEEMITRTVETGRCIHFDNVLQCVTIRIASPLPVQGQFRIPPRETQHLTLDRTVEGEPVRRIVDVADVDAPALLGSTCPVVRFQDECCRTMEDLIVCRDPSDRPSMLIAGHPFRSVQQAEVRRGPIECRCIDVRDPLRCAGGRHRGKRWRDRHDADDLAGDVWAVRQVQASIRTFLHVGES